MAVGNEEGYVRGDRLIREKFSALRGLCDPEGHFLLDALEETMLHDSEILALAGALSIAPSGEGWTMEFRGGGLGAP